MRDEIITFKTAQLAYNKGFCEFPVSHNYDTGGKLYAPSVISLNRSIYDRDWGINGIRPILAPTQTMLQRWLRDSKHIEVYVKPAIVLDFTYTGYYHGFYTNTYNTYEKAMEMALYAALDFLPDLPVR